MSQREVHTHVLRLLSTQFCKSIIIIFFNWCPFSSVLWIFCILWWPGFSFNFFQKIPAFPISLSRIYSCALFIERSFTTIHAHTLLPLCDGFPVETWMDQNSHLLRLEVSFPLENVHIHNSHVAEYHINVTVALRMTVLTLQIRGGSFQAFTIHSCNTDTVFLFVLWTCVTRLRSFWLVNILRIYLWWLITGV